MTTRRGYLVGLGTATVAALAGCGALDNSDTSEPDRLEEAELNGWSPTEVVIPTGLPYSPPDSLQKSHEDRAVELLETVPTEPKIPNEVVKQSVVSERSWAATSVVDGSEADRPLIVLREWRGIRGEAANAYGAYRAATGTSDADTVASRRSSLREAWASLKSNLDYKATTSVEAVVVYGPIEELLEDAIRQIQPRQEYPSPAIEDPEQAGEIIEAIERAEASLDDAVGLRRDFHESRDNLEPQWASLAQSLRQIEVAVDRTESERIPHQEAADPDEIFVDELAGVEEELYREARRSVEYYGGQGRDHREAGRLGMAILGAGRALASIAVFEAVIEGIKGGDFPAEQTPKTLKTAAQEASDSIRKVPTAAYPYLSGSVLDPAASKYGSGVQSSGEYFDPIRAEASFRYASLYASAAVEAASYIADLIEA